MNNPPKARVDTLSVNVALGIDSDGIKKTKEVDDRMNVYANLKLRLWK